MEEYKPIFNLLGMNTVLFCLFLWILTELLRRGGHAIKPGLKDNAIWRDVCLPMFPVVLGALLALSMSSAVFTYPEGISSTPTRVFYGTCCGFFCAWLVRIGKAVVKKILGEKGLEIPPSTGLLCPMILSAFSSRC